MGSCVAVKGRKRKEPHIEIAGHYAQMNTVRGLFLYTTTVLTTRIRMGHCIHRYMLQTCIQCAGGCWRWWWREGREEEGRNRCAIIFCLVGKR